MKKYLIFLISLFILAGSVALAASDLKILAKEEIEKLQNKDLVETYVQAKIETEAYRGFGRTGYSYKEFKEYRALLAFIVDLRREMEKRELDAPPVEEWLK